MGSDVFDDELDLPDPEAQRRYAELIGLDDVKRRLSLEGELLLFPDRLAAWSESQHGRVLRAVETFRRRPPLFVFGGDVGTGKTTLAETFADEIARRHNRDARVLRLSLRSRGSGAVGEMTQLLGQAFDTVVDRARGGGPTVLVIDEADAVAQSRATDQMHHEDRAGVNALIRGIDQVASQQLAIAIVMCTNRADSLDPAVARRATSFSFERPSSAQRAAVLEDLFGDAVGESANWDRVVTTTGPTEGRPYGFTFSDLTQRLLPAVLLAAYPTAPISMDRIEQAAIAIEATPPFGRDGG